MIDQIDKTITDIRSRFEKILEDLKISLYDRVFRFEESFLKYIERFNHATHLHLDVAQASMAGLEPENMRSLYQTHFLKNPIDQQIQEGFEQNRHSLLLVDRLHTIRHNYQELQIDQMKTHIDKIMSSKPICVDFKILNSSIDYFLNAVHAETVKLLNNRVVVNHDLLLSKPLLQKLIPVVRTVPVKTAILSHRRVSPPLTVVHHQPHLIIPAHIAAPDFDARQVRKPPSRTASLERRPEPVQLAPPKLEAPSKPNLKRPEAEKPSRKKVTYEDEVTQLLPVATERIPERDSQPVTLQPAPARTQVQSASLPDTRNEPRIENRNEPRIENRTEPRIEIRTEPRIEIRNEPRNQTRGLPEAQQTASGAPNQTPKDPLNIATDNFVPTGSKTDAPLTLDNRSPQTTIIASLPIPADVSTPCSLNTINKEKLAVGTVSGAVCIFDLSANTFISIQLAQAPVTVLRSLNGLLLAGQDSASNNIAVIDTTKAPPTVRPLAHLGAGVLDLQFLVDSLQPDAGSLFVSLSSNKLGLWSRGGEAPKRTVEASDQPLTCMAVFNSHKTLVAGCKDCTLKLFRVEENDLVYTRVLHDTSPIVAVDSFYNNSNFIISSNSCSEVKIWDTSSGE